VSEEELHKPALSKEEQQDRVGKVPDPSESSKEQSGKAVRHRKREAVETMDEFRYSELVKVRKALARLCNPDRRWWQVWRMIEWEKAFGALAILVWGGFIATGLAMIPFLDAGPSDVAKREYQWLFWIVGAFALVFTVCRFAVRSKEIGSVRMIHDEVDEMVKSYEDEESA
jgi:hypothetical protein